MAASERVGVTVVATEAGWVGLAWSERGLLAVTLPEADEGAALRRLPGGSGPEPQPPPGLDVAVLAAKLQGYFRGEKVTFDEPLDPTPGTDFTRRVWAVTRAIPRGETRTYGQIARQVQAAGAARAVGQAMAHNPWPIVVPCHRVVGHDGRLTGFGGGVALKEHMLRLEGGLIAPRFDALG